MKKQFVTYEIALKLKKIGFKKKCFGYYTETKILHLGGKYNTIDFRVRSKYVEDICQHDDACLAPLWQQVFEWLIKNHSIHIHICVPNKKKWLVQLHTLNGEWIFNDGIDSEWYYDTYGDAREQGILKAIKLIRGNS